MKLLSNFLYSVKQGIKGVFKNKTMSFISIISVSASLIILGIITSIVLNANQFITMAEYEINEIRVSIKDNLDKSSIDNIKYDLNNIKGIKSVEFKDKETMLNDMKSSWGSDSYLLEGLENPLDDCYIVTLENSQDIKAISSEISTINNIKNVEYHQDIVDNFIKISDSIKNFGSVLIIFLILICLVIISNTIKTRVYSKKEEIEVIKYVGGSDNFIRMPFIVEGFTIGIIGSTIALVICIYMYKYIIENINKTIGFISNNMMISVSNIAIFLTTTLFITGITIGVVGSVISVKRHLKV
ncbi:MULTISPECIES: permease-like cell division protein FtsX [Romboutsia]|jgi:cell division transport system permease protein|uniref:Cell division protein FtsX n=1 Tax=Romboutsia ilealis TaxID=1115758 RepID=A0A1V1HZB5_9FIRM|nr:MULTISPECIES: permease-like cell division protein FtsX [Romboutsia]MCI9061063.1 ABC transporter permease [Romboutsia sp.]MCI9259854.1 ABC transporter permease [Romboutsia sp.]CED93285.1 Cell-division protein [Romboutsia ilealis]